MLSVNGYYDGNGYVTEGNVSVKPNQKVIITLLDDYVPVRPHRSISEIKSYMDGSKKSVPDGISTVDYIRQLRAKYKGLKGMDAIHIATSIYYNCDIFLTNDAQLKQVSEANILLVDDM